MGALNSNKQANNLLKARVAAITAKLPSNWKQIIASNHGKYNTLSGACLMDNVKRGKSADAELTGIMELVARGKMKIKIEYETIDA